MSSNMKITNYQRPNDLIEIAKRGPNPQSTQKSNGESFKEMFSRELAAQRNISFSKHASQRLFSRGVELSEANLSQLADAVDKAELKGSKDTLILSDDAAFVVSIKDRTVVTVFDPSNLREGVVTSIDSAVIL